MNRVINFGAGPATLPLEILEQAQAELLDWRGTGMSIMELGHRTEIFTEYLHETEQKLRELLTIPNNYRILFLHGGARAQFAMVPQNLLANKHGADYLDIGIWSQKAIAEAQLFCDVNIVASSKDNNYTSIPTPDTWQLKPTAAYFHYTSNETINGIECTFIPEVGDVPIVVDMTSDILSMPIDVSRFGLIYASAQKNIGIAGLAVVIIREDLLARSSTATTVPSLYNYAIQAEQHSLYNTPASFAIYIASLMFAWLQRQGGLTKIAELNQRKATKLYHAIDHSNGFYRNDIAKPYRSKMNVVFNMQTTQLEQQFLAAATAANLVALKGHRELGGLRASIYNAMPMSSVDTLIDFMKVFQQKHS